MSYIFNPFTGTFDESGSGGGGGSFTGGTLGSELILAPGTATDPPLSFQSGVALTTPEVGAVEYDGKVLYTTPGGRGVSPSMMLYRLNSGLAGSNVNTAQSLLGVGVTLAASTVYAFDSYYVLQKTAGTTSHTIGIGFGGSATLNNLNYGSLWTRENSAATSSSMVTFSAFHAFSTSAANLVLTTAITSAAQTFVNRIAGTVSINAGGTFIPQYTLSSAPGGAYTTVAGSYFAIWPIGAAGTNTSVGPWV